MRKIDFVLGGRLDGVEISPSTIGLSRFNEFNKQVEEFLRGNETQKLDEVKVEVEEGSYKFRTLLPAVLATSLAGDISALQRQDSLGEIDPKREAIISRWQARAKANPEIRYMILPGSEQSVAIEISSKTNYRVGETDPWVRAEKYLYGTIVDMGGAKNANLHLRTGDSSKSLTIGSSEQYLRQQKKNRLYHEALVRVEAFQHYKTGELRDIRLIFFEDYKPRYDEEALDRFAEEGSNAWADDRYAERLKAAGQACFRPISLADGFDRAFFDSHGQRDFHDALENDDGDAAQFSD